MDSLNIDPDDDVSIVEDIERAFGIRLSDSEAARSQTVGDLYQVLLRRVRTVERGNFPCLGATAFRRLRAELVGVSARRITPNTPLGELLPIRNQRQYWKTLEHRCGLVLPPLLLSTTGHGVIATAFVVTAWVCAMSSSLMVAVIAAPLSAWLLYLVCDRWLAGFRVLYGVSTVGDLATEASARNASSLAWQHGSMRKSEVWRVLVHILGRYGDAPINEETRFFPR